MILFVEFMLLRLLGLCLHFSDLLFRLYLIKIYLAHEIVDFLRIFFNYHFCLYISINGSSEAFYLLSGSLFLNPSPATSFTNTVLIRPFKRALLLVHVRAGFKLCVSLSMRWYCRDIVDLG